MHAFDVNATEPLLIFVTLVNFPSGCTYSFIPTPERRLVSRPPFRRCFRTCLNSQKFLRAPSELGGGTLQSVTRRRGNPLAGIRVDALRRMHGMARVERREGARRTSAGGLASCRSGRLACSPTDRPTDRPTDLSAAYSVPPRRLARFAGRFVSFAAKDPESPHAGDFSATKVPDCLFIRGECVRGSMCRWRGIIHAIVQSSSEICARNISRSKFFRRGRQSMR